jgi:hypothetical protein
VGKWRKRGSDIDPPAEGVFDVPIEEYLKHRPAVPRLFDVVREMHPEAFATSDARPDISRLAAVVRSRGDRNTDIRLLVDNGERYVAMAAQLAEYLRCDVFLTRGDSKIRYVREASRVTGVSWDAISISEETGEPADWLVVRPGDLPDDIAMWFVTARGRLRPGSGLVTVALPDGIAFPTKATFRDTGALSARMRSGAGRMTTIAANADTGSFEISRFDSPGALLSGVEFATLVSASLEVVHPDVQLALTWPRGAEACAALHVELARLADALNRTVWVPEPAGAAFVAPGVGEFAAVDEVGGPSSWRPYMSRLANDRAPRFRSDSDGRLVPDGKVVAARFPGVPFVSVPPTQLEQLREWYASVAPCEGLFPVDLAVLADGRLGVLLDGGRPVAMGPRELRALLREAGWTGQDLLLLAQPPVHLWDAAIAHASQIGDLLKVDIWLPERGAEVWAQPDGTLASDGPDGSESAWHVVPYGTDLAGYGDGIPLPAALLRGRRPGDGLPSARDWPTVQPGPKAPVPPPVQVAPPAPPVLDPPTVVAPVEIEAAALLAEAAAATVLSTEAGLLASAQAAVASAETIVAAGTVLYPDETVTPTRLEATLVEVEYEAVPGLDDESRTDDAGEAEEPADADISAPEVADPELAHAVGTDVEAVTVEPVAVVLAPVAGGDLSHSVPWLPSSPVVNHRPLELYLWTPLAAGEIDGWGLPSADLFLLAGQDPLHMADRHPSGTLLRVSAPAKTVVDLLEHARHVPAAVQQRLAASGCTHMLPLAWLSELTVTGRFDLDGDGGVSARRDVDSGELAVRFEGAEHGVAGLPNEVVHWPDKKLRADAPSYLVLPDGPDADDPVFSRGFVALTRKRPAVEEGQRVLEVKIRRRRAIDVPATLDRLAGLPVVGRMHDFVGLDVLLSQTDLSKAVVTKIWRQVDGRQHVDKLTGQTLEDVLASDLAAAAR